MKKVFYKIFKIYICARFFRNCGYTDSRVKDNDFTIEYIMIFNSTKKEYIAPSMVVLDVACEAGFFNSTGNITFGDATDEGWSNLN